MLAFEFEGEVVSQVATFMVSSQQPEGLGVMDLETPEVEDTLYAEVASIDIVTEEEVSGLSGVTSNFKQLHQIVVLAMNVTTDSNGGVHLQEVGLGAQKFGTLPDNPKSLLFGKTTLAIEMLLKKLKVGLGMGVIFEELLVGRLVHGRCLDICENVIDSSQSK
jgi:hypothetical protein